MPDTTIAGYLEHVRSFDSGQSIRIRPLTLLVGENSSGKSTFLAVAGSVFDPAGYPARPALNKPPFNLGTFETIATYKGGRYGRAEDFTIGFSASSDGERELRDIRATYRQDHGAPVLARVDARSEKFRVSLAVAAERLSGDLFLPDGTLKVAFRDSAVAYQMMQQVPFDQGLWYAFVSGAEEEVRSQYSDLLRLGLQVGWDSPFEEAIAVAPIRTKPNRTYDEFAEDYSPEGDHIPSVLARIMSEEPTSQAGRRVRNALLQFGEKSGLFRQVEVRRLGKGPADPFQVHVGVGGPKVNLVDVGYGVSQVLPLVVQSVLRDKKSLLLIQQPEVHLHPRAQAALGTFYAELAAVGQNTFVIETHSDYLVDRVRQEVACGTLKPEQVQILFFDRPKMETTVHALELDELGNIVNAPDSYRQFFLEEELRLIGRGSD